MISPWYSNLESCYVAVVLIEALSSNTCDASRAPTHVAEPATPSGSSALFDELEKQKLINNFSYCVCKNITTNITSQ